MWFQDNKMTQNSVPREAIFALSHLNRAICLVFVAAEKSLKGDGGETTTTSAAAAWDER